VSRIRRTDKELIAAYARFSYEWGMFTTLANGLSSGVFGENNPLGDAVIDSFILHTKTLMDFFYSKDNPRPDQVIAEDFFPSPETWQELRPKKTELIKAVEARMAEARIAQESARLTYTKQDTIPGDRLWYLIPIINELSNVFNIFFQNIPDRLSREFR
jgi:hypothetical protein